MCPRMPFNASPTRFVKHLEIRVERIKSDSKGHVYYVVEREGSNVIEISARWEASYFWCDNAVSLVDRWIMF